MMIRRDSDAILAAWLDAGPVTLPEHVRQAVVDGARTTRQSGARQGVRRTTPGLRRFAAAAAAAILVVSLASVGVGDRSESAPEASPLAPSGSPLVPAVTFESDVYAYRLSVPTRWQPVPATQAWTLGEPTTSTSPWVDRILSPRQDLVLEIRAATSPRTSSRSLGLEHWRAMYASSLAAGNEPHECGPAPSWKDIRVGDTMGSSYVQPCGVTALAVVDERMFVFFGGATDGSAVAASDVEQFLMMIGSVDLTPGTAPEGPSATGEFSSTVHSYRARYPVGWGFSAGSRPWAGAEPWGPVPEADRATSPDGNERLFVASVAVPAGVPIEDWMEEMLPPRRTTLGNCRGSSSYVAGRTPEKWQPEVVAGRPGVVRSECGFVEGLVVVGQRAWIISYRKSVPPSAMPFANRAVFDDFAATVEVRPDANPATSPAPSPEAPDRTFTSSLYGYSIRIPGTWSATSASERWTGDWRWVLARVADSIRGKQHELTVVSGLIEPGANEQEWIDAHFPPRTSGSGYCSTRGQMARPELPQFQFRQWGPIDWERFACGYVEGVAIEGGRAWLFSLRGRFEPGGDYEKFEELMRTVELHPEDIPSAVP